jgi:O-antigen/teichoic acid export membrane protein
MSAKMDIDRYIDKNRSKLKASGLASASLISQILFMLAIAVIGKNYGKDILGNFFVLYSIQAVGTSLLTLRFDALILHEKNVRIANEDYQVATNMNLLILIILIGCHLSGWGSGLMLGSVKLKDLIVGSEYSCMATIYILGCSYLSRCSSFKPQIISRIGGAASFAVLIGMSPEKTLSAVTLAFTTSLIVQNAILQSSGKLTLVNPRVMTEIATNKRVRSKIRYGLSILVPASFIDALSQQFPVYILAGTLGLPGVALYSVCQRVAQFPVSLLAPGVVSMYGPKLATIREKGQLFKRSTKKMILLAVLTYVLMGLIGPTILKAMSVNNVAEGAYVLGALNLNGLIILASTLVSPTLLSLGVKYAPIICATSALFYRPIAFMIGLKMFGTLAAACLLCSIAEATQIIITARFTCKHLSLAG